MEEIMNGFKHKEHPLKLIENIGIGGDDQVEVTVCNGCQEPISEGSAALGCIECRYFLHKDCAQLEEPSINHHLHFKHPLNLYLHHHHWNCDICGDLHPKNSFGYRCTPCLFYACIKCGVASIALKKEASMKVEHQGHPNHTLNLHLRPGSVLCDACKTEDKDFFYQCNDCDFFIHKTCASLGPTIDLPHHHNHPLVLAYSLPDNFFNFKYYCEFCKGKIKRVYWVYHCANCRYFAHVKCALNAKNQPSSTSVGASTLDVEDLVVNDEIIQFPMSDNSVDLLSLHFEKISSTGSCKDNDAGLSNHWSHEHPLILNVEAQGENAPNIGSNDPIVVCYGCVRPLSLPFYSCKDKCEMFYLHKYCAELPRTLEHQLHPNHPLQLINFNNHDYWAYDCSFCYNKGNKFLYECASCEFYLDVNCAFLPNIIKHEKHEHPLAQIIDSKSYCNACDNRSIGMSYACKTCKFQLAMECAVKAPRFLSHRYCKGHSVPLIYPPVPDHPQDFYCDICETEMHPKFWLYYCAKCDSTFHIGCIQRIDYYENFTLVGTISQLYHKHPISYVRRKKSPRYVCSNCNLDINGHLIVECQTCDFKICLVCHEDISYVGSSSCSQLED